MLSGLWQYNIFKYIFNNIFLICLNDLLLINIYI